jgi:hypothetical protein
MFQAVYRSARTIIVSDAGPAEPGPGQVRIAGLAMTTPGDTSAATVAEVGRLAAGGGARVVR